MSFLARVPPEIAVALGAALTATSALLRRQPLSWDEAVTVAVAERPVAAIAGTLHHSDAVLGTYYLLMHGWGHALTAAGIRPTDTWWRLPSALAAVATCVVVAAVARRQGGTSAALAAGGLLAVLPLFVFYSVDARPYTVAALTAVSAWAVWTRPATVRRPLAHATFTAVLLVTAAWLQLFTVLVWPAFVLVAGPGRRRRATAVLLAATAGVAPLLAVAARQGSEIGWIPPASPANTLRVALHVGGGIVVVALLVTFGVLAVRSGLLRRGPDVVAVAWWTGAPLVLLAALDTVRPVLVARYALVSLPLVAVAFGVVVVRGARGRTGPALRVVGGGVLVACVVTSIVQDAAPWKYEDYRGAAAFTSRAVTRGTPVLFAPSSARLGFDRYASSSYLHDVALPHGVGADPLAIAEVTPPLLRELVGAQCRAVLVGDPFTATPDAAPVADRTKLAAVSGWRVETARGFGAVTVTVLSNPRCAPAEPAAG